MQKKIINLVIELKLVFKNFIFLNDIEKEEVLILRNEDYIRKNMINTEYINLENHNLFINNLKKIENKKYYAIYYSDEFIGSVNFVKTDKLSWGFYFKEEINPILKSLCAYIFLNFIFDIFNEPVNSFVRKNNTQALNFNKSFGFKIFDEDKEYIYLCLEKFVWEKYRESRLFNPIKKYLTKINFEFIKLG